jgi:hypothetical protein
MTSIANSRFASLFAFLLLASGACGGGAGRSTTSGSPSDGGPSDGGPSDGGPTGKVAGKRGVAYGFKAASDLQAFPASVSWWYNWSPQPDPGAAGASTMEFVPMVWGGSFDVNQLAATIPAGARYLLTFNEPNFGAQSNLTPEAAAALWPRLQQLAARRGLKLVSPALNYCGGACNETDPFVWLEKFFAACSGCQVDYIAMHWYACNKDALVWYLGRYKAKYAQPLWLTEFACLDDAVLSDAKEAQYLQDAVGVLEADPAVFRYSWFTGRFPSQPVVNLLAAPAGILTPLGKAYGDHPAGP